MPDKSNTSTAAPRGDTVEAYIEIVIGVLKAQGVKFEPGLSDSELAAIEIVCDLLFPPDLRAFLRHSLPAGEGFPNWRGSEITLRKILSWPVEGICFDIERDGFWLPSWAPRPAELATALAEARQALAKAPRLVPIYKHRYIPSEPPTAGNPVLSVYQTDIIHYGNDLPGYFNREFGVPLPAWARPAPQPIRFWDELIRFNAQRE